ncbi:hypothetical protein CY34DRAFT_14763 [Suillus luteus UH-Slu-Lm8-n1]|uniref:Mid2 domain-containing protein n=1 Tax=Suillus luteus UH-Slu-Lm8-n1 TaxID=930992 RepID=A0A0D0AWZ5_9AGAM|nr:hypothetical protein CY34DRAFT_14763 [Suillus luteus UH-Slu-Lm8-n1]
MSYSTVTAVPTTASPTTSTPITTYSGSSNAPSSTTPGSTGTTPIANSMTSVATTVPTTITSTNSYGSTTVITTHTYTITPVAVPTPSPVNNSSNTGAIVGGVVGGLAAIALLALLFFWLRRRRRRGQSDGNYDQGRIEPQPSGGGTHIDLGEDPVTPYVASNNMREYGGSSFRGASADAAEMGVVAAAAGTDTRRTSSQPSPSLQHSVASASHSGDPSQRFVRPGPGEYSQGGPSIHATQQADTPRPLTSPASSVVASSSGRMMKEQEAAADRQGFGLSTQQEAEGEGSGVVQHRDAGQALGEERGEMRDVPPAYESISQ